MNASISQYITTNEVTESIFGKLGWEPDKIDYMTDSPEVVCHRAADTTRAKELLDWKPKHTLDWYTDARDEKHVKENLETLPHER